jgi:hypothetical protein
MHHEGCCTPPASGDALAPTLDVVAGLVGSLQPVIAGWD